jgi:hypothetical protein
MHVPTGKFAIVFLGFLLAVLSAADALALTEGKTAQGLVYVSGGIALGERDALDAQRANYSLWVATAVKKTGSYLADVRIRISDAADKTVLDTKLDGPWLLVNLALGRYTVEASFRDQIQRKITTMHGGDRHEMLFYFDLAVETLPPDANS